MIDRRIRILRQYPAAAHDAAFEHLEAVGEATVSRYQYEISSNPRGAPQNARFLAEALLLRRGETIVLGAEPYDPRVLLFDRLARRHEVVLHTSWPRWGTNEVPQPTSSERRRERWQQFLGRVHAVGVTEAAMESVRDMGASAATHVPHAVDTDRYRPAAGLDRDCRDRPVVTFVGRLERRKGVEDLLDVAQEWDGPEVCFRFVGDGPLASVVREAATTDCVDYEGYVGNEKRLASLYATSDVFVLPSFAVDGWEELFGIVVIEAFASGLPVVATDCVGPEELVDDGETGYVVPQRDRDALADRIERLLTDDEARAAMGWRARAVAERRYDRAVTAEQWAGVFDVVGGDE